jgi:FixJ family two-component response regulator
MPAHVHSGARFPKSEPVVFLLDDDTKFVNALSALLQANGFATRVFTSVDDFLREHDLDCPGCLVLDVRMPKVTGLDLQLELVASGVMRPIVFVTACHDQRLCNRAMAAGAVAVLPKPVRSGELLSAIQEALRKDAVERGR